MVTAATKSEDTCFLAGKDVKSLSRVQFFVTPWTVTYQAPLSMGFSRQEHWSGLLFPSPGDLPDLGLKPSSPALHADTLPSEPPGKESYDKPRQHIEKQRHCSANKCPYSQSYGFPSDHVWLWELAHKEGGVPKNWCFLTVGLLRVPWTARRSNQSFLREINPKHLLEGLVLKLNSSRLAIWCQEPTHW